MTPQEKQVSPFLHLWLTQVLRQPFELEHPVGPGEAVEVLSDGEAAGVAAAGIRALSFYLPSEEAARVEAAVKGIEMERMASVEQILVQVGASLSELHPVVVGGHDPDSPPGCCVRGPYGGWTCVRQVRVPEIAAV